MTLGSPTHSPSGSPNVGFLPPFLLGEINPPSTPRTNSLSPTKGRNLAFGKSLLITQYNSGSKQIKYLYQIIIAIYHIVTVDIISFVYTSIYVINYQK